MKNKFYNRRLEEIENTINSTNLTNLEKNDLMSNIESLVAHELITIINDLKNDYEVFYGSKSRIARMEKINQWIKN